MHISPTENDISSVRAEVTALAAAIQKLQNDIKQHPKNDDCDKEACQHNIIEEINNRIRLDRLEAFHQRMEAIYLDTDLFYREDEALGKRNTLKILAGLNV
jgi:hypothetical protein